MAEPITTARKRFDAFGRDGLYTLSEGNPGAVSVIMLAAKEARSPEGILFLMNLDDMNIRGAQIWVAYKDVCGSDLQQLIERVSKRDANLVAEINRFIPDGERAVAHGTSFAHR